MDTRDYAVAPGEYLVEWMEENASVTQGELAEKLGISRKQVNAILRGRARISADIAVRLEHVTSIPVRTWCDVQALYDADCARLSAIEFLAPRATFISPELGTYLRKKGVTSATKSNPGQLVYDFLSLVQCGSFDAYEQRVEREVLAGSYAALRESGKNIDPAALLAWISLGDKETGIERCFEMNYDEDTLRSRLPMLRRRASVSDANMLTDLEEMLVDVGVILRYVDPPKSFPLHGITQWIDNVPVVYFTARRKADGFVVWALFHELGHVLNDSRDGGPYGLLKSSDQKQREDRQANAFASALLFGPEGMSPFRGLEKSSEIARAAADVGVSPGVAVVAMHRKRMLPYNYGTDLLVDVAV